MPRLDMKSGNVTLRHLGNLAPPAELEESASHHVEVSLEEVGRISFNTVRQHAILVSGEVIWGAETSPRGQIS